MSLISLWHINLLLGICFTGNPTCDKIHLALHFSPVWNRYIFIIPSLHVLPQEITERCAPPKYGIKPGKRPGISEARDPAKERGERNLQMTSVKWACKVTVHSGAGEISMKDASKKERRKKNGIKLPMCLSVFRTCWTFTTPVGGWSHRYLGN